jgi:hypothetical protein
VELNAATTQPAIEVHQERRYQLLEYLP